MSLWDKCLDSLENEFPSQQFNTWIRPLQAELIHGKLVLFAPNRFVLDWIVERFLARINELVQQFSEDETPPSVLLEIGSKRSLQPIIEKETTSVTSTIMPKMTTITSKINSINSDQKGYQNNLNANFTFVNFVEGKSNQLAKAACLQVAENPAIAYNPLFLYGGVGLGKTHLMHAIGNQIIQANNKAKVLYLHSERFVADMVKALQTNAMNEFKR